MTHLFTDEQVVLTKNWLQHIVPIHTHTAFRHLELFRPSGLDLILTKMMRHDPQDLQDIQFLLGREKITTACLTQALADACIPPVAEITQIFQAMQPIVVARCAELRP